MQNKLLNFYNRNIVTLLLIKNFLTVVVSMLCMWKLVISVYDLCFGLEFLTASFDNEKIYTIEEKIDIYKTKFREQYSLGDEEILSRNGIIQLGSSYETAREFDLNHRDPEYYRFLNKYNTREELEKFATDTAAFERKRTFCIKYLSFAVIFSIAATIRDIFF